MVDTIEIRYKTEAYMNICETLYFIDGICICSFDGKTLTPRNHPKLLPFKIEQLIEEYHRIYGVKYPKFNEFNTQQDFIKIRNKYGDYEVVVSFSKKEKTAIITSYDKTIHKEEEKVLVKDIDAFDDKALINWAKINNLI